MKHFNIYLTQLLVLAMLGIPGKDALAQYKLQIFHASDLEGGVEAIGKAPRFAAIIDTLEHAYPNTLILSAGDNYISGPFYSSADASAVRDSIQKVYKEFFNVSSSNLREGPGRIDISVMNLIGFHASALGNHEFDLGTAAISGVIKPDVSGAAISNVRWVGNMFPYLSSNLDFKADNNLFGIFDSVIKDADNFKFTYTNTAAKTKSIAPATYITVNGEKIGVVGATTPMLQRISSPGDTKVKNPGAGTNDMNALASLIQPQIDALVNDHSINKIILVSHLQQYQLEVALAPLLSKVDVIISGGSDAIFANAHNRLNPGDAAVQPYPLMLRNKDGDPVAVVSTDGQYSYVGRLVVEFDASGKIDTTKIDLSESRPYPSDSLMVDSLYGFNYAAAWAPRSKGAWVKTLTDAVRKIVETKDGNIVGKTDVYLDGRRATVRTQESNLGNLSADANLWQARQYDNTVKVSIKNGGGIREAIGSVTETKPGVYTYGPPAANGLSGKKQGEVSQLDLENTMKFNNRLTILETDVPGLRRLFEHGVAAWAPGATPGQMIQVGGAQFSFDPSLPANKRIRNFVLVDDAGNVTDTIVKGGQNYGDTTRRIRFVTLNFLAGGGDGYPFSSTSTHIVQLDTLGTLPAGNFTFTVAGSEQDALAEYMNTKYSSTPFDQEETPLEEDRRIQILSRRPDGIFPIELEFTAKIMEEKENSGTVAIALNYNNTTSDNSTVNVRVNPLSSATEGTDFTISNKSFTANAGSNGTFNFDITITDDGSAEEDEYIILEVDPAGNHLLKQGYLIVFVKDNDRTAPTPSKAIELRLVDSYSGLQGGGNTTEIVAFDKDSKRLYIANSGNAKLEILDFSNPDSTTVFKTVDVSAYGDINSVSVKDGKVACAMAAPATDAPGKVVFFDTKGDYLADFTVGVLPDMVTFSHDGKKVIVACEGEPNDDYDVDPDGSIAIIDITNGLSTATVDVLNFNAWDAQKSGLLAQGVRIFGNYGRSSVSQDIEPEYVAVSADNKTAYVACQENNALVFVDLQTHVISDIKALGTKDYSASGNGLDANRNLDSEHISNFPIKGYYMPDAIATYEVGGQTYVVSANEGDSRDYDGYSEEVRFRAKDVKLDRMAWPNAPMVFDLVGDVNITLANGDTDGDGDLDEIYVYGSRSFSIWNGATGALVYDSGNELEVISSTHPEYAPLFNRSNSASSKRRNRTDDKGPEPEALALGTMSGKHYAFVGAERSGGIYVYDITNPAAPIYVHHHNNRDTATGGGDLGPEGVVFIPYSESPSGVDMLVVANEVSATISVYHVYDAQLDTNTTPIGVPMVSVGENLNIYPNPTSGKVNISSTDARIRSINVMGLTGAVLEQADMLDAKHYTMDLGNLQGQVFILHIATDKGDYRQVVMKP